LLSCSKTGSYSEIDNIPFHEIDSEPFYSCLYERELKIHTERSPFRKIYDPKSGLSIYVLDVVEDTTAIDMTKGILSELGSRLEEAGVTTTELVKRAWKTSDQ
jgi:hypothetical protein